MRNPKRYSATFCDLIMTVFAKEQVVKWRGTITMYQVRDCPELWAATPVLRTGREKWEATTARELAKRIEGDFVRRESKWIEVGAPAAAMPPVPPQNVVPIDVKRRRA